MTVSAADGKRSSSGTSAEALPGTRTSRQTCRRSRHTCSRCSFGLWKRTASSHGHKFCTIRNRFPQISSNALPADPHAERAAHPAQRTPPEPAGAPRQRRPAPGKLSYIFVPMHLQYSQIYIEQQSNLICIHYSVYHRVFGDRNHVSTTWRTAYSDS